MWFNREGKLILQGRGGDLQQQSPREGAGEWNGSRALEESWFSLRAQVDPKSGKVWSDWGNMEEVGPVGNGAGGRALKARSGSVDVILGVVESHGRF